jgi:UDP-GlcNAc:undecaprenyl-phosphate/decaprenyl-phosphate GlcNAc-1-phosphate transferase
MSFWGTLRDLLDDGTALWGFGLAMAITIGLVPFTIVLAKRVGAIDHPGADRPRVHSKPIPRIGGLAMVIGILVPALLLVHLDGPRAGIVLAIPIVAAIGLADDIRGLSPRAKMLAIVGCALIPVWGYGMRFHSISLPVLGNWDMGWVGWPLTVIWIAALANLVNLIDGMDALAAGIVGIAAAAFTILAASFGRLEVAAIAAIVCGATAGFLPFNFHPARVFMGDTGALTLGFVLGALSVDGVLKSAATIALIAPLLVMSVPILDTSFVVLKRLKYRRPPWGADHNHFYHRFLRIGFSQRRAAAYLHAWAALLAAYALLLRFVPPRPFGIWDTGNALIASAAGIVVLAASVWIVYTLEILKMRHFTALRLRKAEPEEEAAVEEVLEAGSR